MNWYRKSQERTAARTRRDRKRDITLYHVSPDRLGRIGARSNFYGVTGAYLSPSYRSAVEDWADYVINKKHQNHPLQKIYRELVQEENELSEIKNPSKEVTDRLSEIAVKIYELNASAMSEGYQSMEGYRTLYIHKILCPREVMAKCQQFFQDVRESGYLEGAWNFWGWGDQVFIPEKYLGELKIISVEKLNMSQFHDKLKDMRLKRYLDFPGQEFQERIKREWNLED